MGLHKKKGLHNETKDEKNVCYRKWKFLLLHLITCHNIFWPNRYTYSPLKHGSRGGCRGRAPLPRKVSLPYLCLFWDSFSAKYPKFSRLASLAGQAGLCCVAVVHPSRKNVFIRAWLLCNNLLHCIGLLGITINNAHIHYCTFYVTWTARASTSIVPMGLHKGKSGTGYVCLS